MKNAKRTISVVFLMLMIIAVFSYPCSAVTLYEQDGFTYSRSSSTTADIYGRTGADADLVIPKDFSEYYVKNIADSAFEGDQNIQTISFGKAILLERIGFYAFKNCINLSDSVNIGGRINTIGLSAFENCQSLKSVVFNAYVKNISDQCFYKCSSLDTVVLNNRIESIGKFAFADCVSLKEIEIPKSVSHIDDTAFDNDDIVIQCYRGSYAEQFAKDNSIEFEILDPVKGDTNGSDKIDINDATLIQKYKAGIINLSKTALRAADVNGDGQVTVRDATLIQMRIANIINEF